jgi:hypothetical protein
MRPVALEAAHVDRKMAANMTTSSVLRVLRTLVPVAALVFAAGCAPVDEDTDDSGEALSGASSSGGESTEVDEALAREVRAKKIVDKIILSNPTYREAAPPAKAKTFFRGTVPSDHFKRRPSVVTLDDRTKIYVVEDQDRDAELGANALNTYYFEANGDCIMRNVQQIIPQGRGVLGVGYYYVRRGDGVDDIRGREFPMRRR